VAAQSEEATDADLELFGSLLLLEILKEFVVSGQLCEPPPCTQASLLGFEAHFEAVFPGSAGSAGSADSTGAAPLRSSEGVASLAAVAAEALGPVSEVSAQEVAREMEVNYRRISALLTARGRLLMDVAFERLHSEFTAVVELRHRIRATRSSTFFSTDGFQKTSLLYGSEVQVLVRALNRLKGSAAYVHMNPHARNGEPAYVFREADMNIFLDELMAGLAARGKEVLRSREELAAEFLNGYLEPRSAALTCELHQFAAGGEEALPSGSPEAQASPQSSRKDASPTSPVPSVRPPKALQPPLDARVRIEVAERGCRMVFEVDRLHLVIRELRGVSSEIEYRLNSEVWERVRGCISTLTCALTAETGHFREGHGELAHKVASQMREIREYTTAQFTSMAAKNYAVQERAVQDRPRWREVKEAEAQNAVEEEEQEQSSAGLAASPNMGAAADPLQASQVSVGMRQKVSEVARRDQVLTLQLKVMEMRNWQFLARMFHIFKCQAMQQRFEEQIESLYMTLDSNRELCERIAQVEQQKLVTATDFMSTARQMSSAEHKIEDLRSKVNADSDVRQRLQNWRRNKTKQLAHVDQMVKEHKRLGTVDVTKLMTEINVKAEKVRELQQDRNEDEEVAGLAASNSSQKTAKVRGDLMKQRVVKEDIHQELQRLRAEVERGGPDDETRLRLWRGRAAAAQERLQELREENYQLRMLAAQRRNSMSPSV